VLPLLWPTSMSTFSAPDPAVQVHHRAPQFCADLVNVVTHATTSHCLVRLSMN
jgi:hypothetical protein